MLRKRKLKHTDNPYQGHNRYSTLTRFDIEHVHFLDWQIGGSTSGPLQNFGESRGPNKNKQNCRNTFCSPFCPPNFLSALPNRYYALLSSLLDRCSPFKSTLKSTSQIKIQLVDPTALSGIYFLVPESCTRTFQNSGHTLNHMKANWLYTCEWFV